MVIYYIIFLIIVVFLYTKTFENFETVAYNNSNFSDNKIDSIYDTESNTLQSLFNNLNLQNKDFKEYNLDNQFKLLNINLIFPFTTIFKKMIIDGFFWLYNFVTQISISA